MLTSGFFVLGLLTGIFGGLTGIGGGPLLVPLLVAFFHVPIHSAIGTSLISVLAASSAAATNYLQKGLVNMRLAVALEIATVTGALMGSSLSAALDERTLSAIFVVLLLALGVRMTRSTGSHPEVPVEEGKVDVGVLGSSFVDTYSGETVFYRVHRLNWGVLASVFAGGLSGLLGIGGGVIKVPLMVSIMRIPIRAAAATGVFMIGITASASLSVYLLSGFFDPMVAAPVAAGVLVGASMGSRLQGRVRSSVLRKIFVVVMFALAIQMALRVLRVM